MKNTTKWTISFLHSFILLLLSSWWMNSPHIYDNEAAIIKWSSYARSLVIQSGEKVSPGDFLFIDLSHEKALIPSKNQPGQDVITDRQKLAAFFQAIKSYHKEIKYILCDVFLSGKSPNDSTLQHAINGIPNLIFAASYDENGKAEKLNFKLNQGITDYKMSDGKFIKLNLFQNQKTPTLPVEMYSHLSGAKFHNKFGLNFQNDQLCFNYIIVDYKIKPYEIFKDQKYTSIRLSALLAAIKNPKVIPQFLKDRIIIMGDFENDVHETVFGAVPGSLILLNTYLSMVDGKHLVGFWWIIFLIIIYTIFSRIMLFHISNYKKKRISYLGPLIKSAFYLSASSVLSYLIFAQHLQVAFLTIYMSTLIFIIQVYQRPKHWKYYFKKKAKEIKETFFA